MSQKYNQLSRYGAMSKGLPFTTGKTFFLVSSSEYANNNFLEAFPVDGDGINRVYSSWADVITAIQRTADASCVVVSPLFTTAPTLAQIDALNAAGVVTIQAGQNLPDGSYIATKAAFALATATTIDLFQSNGRIQLEELIAEVVTTLGSAQTTKFLVLPTVGSSTDLCAAASVGSLAIGAYLGITGTFANPIVATTQGAIPRQAVSVVVKAGKIQLNNTQTSTGNLRVRVKYKPIDPGAFVSPL